MSETLDTNLETGKRPGFLTVLCILTFIGSGLGIIGGLLGLVGSSALGMFAPEGTVIVQVVGLLASVLCLFGALKMWGLYKQGFIIYVLGSLLAIAGSIISALSVRSIAEETLTTIEGIDPEFNDALSTAATNAATSVAWTGVIIGIIINILFIVLYNANRKHLIK